MALRRRKKKVNKEEIEAKKANGKLEAPKELEAASKSEDVKSASDESARRPLFYKQPVPLSFERHGDKSINLKHRFGFAAETNMVPVNMQEFSRIAISYPIVFTEAAPANAIAILGLRQGQNLFVNDEGAWDGGNYVPAYVRRYPFIFSGGQEEEQLVLCIDEADNIIVDGTDGENRQAIYEDKEASEVVKKMLEFCAAFHRQSLATREFVDELESRDLFRPGTVTITNESGEQFNLRGFRIIDETKFNVLPDDAFLQFRRKGWLQAINSHLISIQNLAALGYRSKAAESN